MSNCAEKTSIPSNFTLNFGLPDRCSTSTNKGCIFAPSISISYSAGATLRKKAYSLFFSRTSSSAPSKRIWSKTIQPPSRTETVTIFPPFFKSLAEIGNSRICSLASWRLPSSTPFECPLISNFFSAEFTITLTTERLGLASTKSTTNFHLPCFGNFLMPNNIFASWVLQPEVLHVPPQVSSGPGNT